MELPRSQVDVSETRVICRNEIIKCPQIKTRLRARVHREWWRRVFTTEDVRTHNAGNDWTLREHGEGVSKATARQVFARRPPLGP